MNVFKSIFEKYDTDKTENFAEAYEKLLTPIRDEIKLIFEIGVNRGGSVRGFKEFFPNALIVGIDINPECYFEEDRIKIEISDATDIEFSEMLVDKYGEPDIVIDDGSHFSHDIIDAFNAYSPFVKKCYIIEDIGTQNPSFNNGFYITEAGVTDIVTDEVIETMLENDSEFSSIHSYYSIAFMFKRQIL